MRVDPVSDELFELAPPVAAAGALVVGWPEVAAGLREMGRPVAEADDLTPAALAAAGVVVMAPAGGAVPPGAMAVLAARRVLVTGPVATTFGLSPGIEFMHAAAADSAIQLANIALVHPDAFVTVRVLGALAAERHRASATP